MSHQSARPAGVVSERVDSRPEVVDSREDELENDQEESESTEGSVSFVQQNITINTGLQPQEKVMTTQPSTTPAVTITPEQLQALQTKISSLPADVIGKVIAMDQKDFMAGASTLVQGKKWHETTAFKVGLATVTLAATGVAVHQYRQARQAKLEVQNLGAILGSGQMNADKTEIKIALPVAALNSIKPAGKTLLLNDGAMAMSF